MHPDHYDFIVKALKLFLVALIIIYSFKCGRIVYRAIHSVD